MSLALRVAASMAVIWAPRKLAWLSRSARKRLISTYIGTRRSSRAFWSGSNMNSVGAMPSLLAASTSLSGSSGSRTTRCEMALLNSL